MVKVFKFGGTCTGDLDSLQQISKLISNEADKLVITLSAAAGVTDRIKSVLSANINETIIEKLIDDLRDKHRSLLPESIKIPEEIDSNLERLERLMYGIYYTEELTDRTYDLVMSFGERLICPILRELLKETQISSKLIYPEDFLITEGIHNSSLVLLDETEIRTKPLIKKAFEETDTVIVPGFYGVSEENVVTLLGRSGTDYTATSIAYAINAESVTIWKDVHGFMSADPILVEDAHTIPNLTYSEAAELAYFGATLLHPRAASPARLKKIPIFIRHLFHPDSVTKIHESTDETKMTIKSVSHMTDLAVVKVYAALGGNTRGVMVKIADQINKVNGNAISIATSQTCIAFLMAEYQVHICADSIRELSKSIVDSVEVETGISLICIVGEGLGSTPGIASRAFDAVASKNVNVELISAGASEAAYHFTISEKDLKKGLTAIHKEFFS